MQSGFIKYILIYTELMLFLSLCSFKSIHTKSTIIVLVSMGFFYVERGSLIPPKT